MMHDVVPTILITGFLGSGKTTLINKILSIHPDKKISLILNEFGSVMLESKFIEVKGVGIVSELSGGCLCCVANVDLPRIIRYTLEQAPMTEYLIIEASGLSDPDPVRSTLTSHGLSTLIHLDTVVAVVDADNFESTSKGHPLVLSQIAEADYAVISKTSSHSQLGVTSLVERVSNIGLGTKTFVWDDNFDTSILFDPPLTPKIISEHHHIHSHYDQYYYQSNGAHDINKLSQVLSQLGGNVLRVKGYSNEYLFQKVGHHVDIRLSKNDTTQNTAILVLGMQLDRKYLESLFASAKLSQ